MQKLLILSLLTFMSASNLSVNAQDISSQKNEIKHYQLSFDPFGELFGGNQNELSQGMISDGEKDIKDTSLDSKPINKEDPHGINGIYYTNTVVIGNLSKTPAKKSLRKFHINYVKSDDTSVVYEVNNRFSLNESDDFNWVEKFNLSAEKKGLKVSKKAGFLEFNAPGANNYSFIGTSYRHLEDDGKFHYPEKETPEKQSFGTFYVYSPGIIISFDNQYGDSSSSEHKEMLSYYSKYYKPLIFYKKEKEKEALSLKPDQIHNAMNKFSIKRAELYAKGGAGDELPRPGRESLNPMFAEAKKQSLKAMQKYLADNGMSHFVPIYSYVYNDNPSIADVIITHPQTGNQVKSGRLVPMYIVCKNLKKTSDNNSQKYSSANHVFFWLNLVEDVKDKQYNTNKYTGKWYVQSSNPPYGIDENENVMKFKGK